MSLPVVPVLLCSCSSNSGESFHDEEDRNDGDLADVVYDVIGGGRTDRIGRSQHPATKIFQALRIFINDELNELDYAMAVAHKLLRPRGIFVGITFHSMECKIVKENLHSADWRNRYAEARYMFCQKLYECGEIC